MKKIVIIGSSVAGVKCAELIREKDKESKISILCYDEYYPYDRDPFLNMVIENDTSKDISYKDKEFYTQNLQKTSSS